VAGRSERPNPFIAVAGNIATGKTGLVKRLAAALGAEALEEHTGVNPYFRRFYAEPGRWAFHSQVAFASDSLGRHIQALTGGPVVQDRTMRETVDVFSRLLREREHLSGDQFQILADLGRCARRLPRQPTLLIYLHAPATLLLERISNRGRAAERHITLDYLADLDSLYRDFIADWDVSPVLSLDTGIHDLRQPDELDGILDLINSTS
jgi:deoxyadenosine/deoxycytidine kinase